MWANKYTEQAIQNYLKHGINTITFNFNITATLTESWHVSFNLYSIEQVNSNLIEDNLSDRLSLRYIVINRIVE
jgi:hypothetical protein